MTTSKLETVTLGRIREVRAEAEAHRESWKRKTWQSAVSGCRIVAFFSRSHAYSRAKENIQPNSKRRTHVDGQRLKLRWSLRQLKT